MLSSGTDVAADRHLVVTSRLRDRRHQLGLTQKQVVTRLARHGVLTTNKVLSSLEHGAGVDVARLPELAASLDCTVTYLLGLTEIRGDGNQIARLPDPHRTVARSSSPGARRGSSAREFPNRGAGHETAERWGMRGTVRRAVVSGLVAVALLSGCGDEGEAGSGEQAITLYTCVTDATAKAVIADFTKSRPGSKVELFRAPTGQLNARVAADIRGKGLQADVFWTCDPMTMHGYAEQKLLRPWTPANAAEIPAPYRAEHFAGVDLLYLVAVVRKGQPAPRAWADLAGPAYRGAVALPDPGFAASALGMLGYFAAEPGYGLDYFQRLKANGAVQVKSPDDVLTGVAEGRYKAGFTLANAAYLAQRKGSPVEVVWPRPGAIAIYAPVAVTSKNGGQRALAEDFASYVASREGQRTIAATQVYSVLPDVEGPPIPAGAPVVAPEWPALWNGTAGLLAQYRTIFGG